SVRFWRIFLLSDVPYFLRGVSLRVPAFGSPGEKDRQNSFDVISKSSPMRHRCLVPDTHDECTVEAGQGHICYGLEIIETPLIIGTSSRFAVLELRACTILSDQKC